MTLLAKFLIKIEKLIITATLFTSVVGLVAAAGVGLQPDGGGARGGAAVMLVVDDDVLFLLQTGQWILT